MGLVHAWEKRVPGEPDDLIAWLHARGALAEATLDRVARSSGSPMLLAAEAGCDPVELRILGEVGRGSMGEVLLARDERLHRTVAVKRLYPRFFGDPAMVGRFRVEAQLTAQLDHPGIVPVHALDSQEGQAPSYSMKLVRGVTLREWFNEARERADRRERQPSRQALAARLELFCHICEPMAYAHSRGVIHRDLKPDNVMVGPFGEVFVMDWGVARLVAGSEASRGAGGGAGVAGGGTELGEVVGTPSYMSPEQARGENDCLDGSSDQFALGLLLFELATLRRARGSVGGGAIASLCAAMQGHVDPIVGLRELLPREIHAVIGKATAGKPADRYPDVTALADDVRRVLRGEAVMAAPDTPVQRVGRVLARNRERVVVALVVLTLVVAATFALGVAGVLVSRNNDRAAAEVRMARRVGIAALVSERARGLERELLRDEGLLRGLAAATPRALAARSTSRAYLAKDFKSAETAPPDLAPSAFYRTPASFAHPDIVLAPGFDRSNAGPMLASLASLRNELAAVILGSAKEAPVDEASSRALVLTKGAPVVWAYAATVDGALVGFPGTGDYPPQYDPRGRPWYREGLNHEVPGWGTAYIDESGMGVLISCSMSVRDAAGDRIGVVALDLTVRGLVDTWLKPGDLPAEGFLVAGDASLVARSLPDGEMQGTGDFPYADALPAIRAAPGGQAFVGGRFFAWSRLEVVPWTYVVVGEVGGIE